MAPRGNLYFKLYEWLLNTAGLQGLDMRKLKKHIS